MDNRFGKKYKLCSTKQIQQVFDSKKSVKSYPMIVHYKMFPGKSDAAFQITISAPKRNFKKAHDRNRIKRLLRETIRQNKLILESFLTDKDQTLALFLIYTAREELEFEILQQKTRKILNLIINEISNDTKN